MTLNQIYSQIEEELSIYVDDSNIDRRFIYDLVINTRSINLRNEYNRLRTFGEENIQVLNCVELEIVDANLCCSQIVTGCSILRSKLPLPQTVELHQKNGIMSIKPNTIFGKIINLIEADRIPYLKKDGINNNQIYSFIFNNYLYIYSLNPNYLLIDSVTLRGLFVDPVAAAEYGCSSGHCLDDNSPFPLSSWIFESLTKPIVVQKLLGKIKIKEDLTNDSQDNQIDQQLNIKK